jgi:hypothetical protein
MEFSPSLSQQTMAFFETLCTLLPPASVSDRTCFRRVAEWLKAGVNTGRFNEEIFERVVLYAREAAMGGARNPHAVFVSILKKELKYSPTAANQNAKRKNQDGGSAASRR